MQTVCKFDEYDTDIVIEREQDSFEILGLHALRAANVVVPLAVFIVQDGLYLGKSVHQRSNLVSEQIAYIFDSVAGIFHDIVEQCRANGFVAKSDFRNYNLRHLYRVDNVWLARSSSDIFVGLIGKFK